jgi:predicted nucleotidyltransferase component of viral defense system
MKNSIKSIQAKLRNVSRAGNKNHQLTITRFFQERFLFRLSQSAFKNHFYLKGGVLIYALEGQASRPTLDLDLLARKTEANQAKIKSIFQKVCGMEYDEDGVTFDATAITTTEIAKEGNYSGIRVKVMAYLGNIRQGMQIDIGFGDIVIPGPVNIRFPTLLEMDAPELLAYSVESLIAEKFEAMIDLAEFNSRMKDFYDVYRILQARQYNEKLLKQAIAKTMARRGTAISTDHAIFSDEFKNDERRRSQWRAFLRRANLNEGLAFSEVMGLIKERLKPIYLKLS